MATADLRPEVEQGVEITVERLKEAIHQQHAARLYLLHALIAKSTEKKPKGSRKKKNAPTLEKGIDTPIVVDVAS